MDDNKKIEYGVDHKDDHQMYRTIRYSQDYIDYDGSKSHREGYFIKARNKIVDLSIPEGKDGRIVYTPWETVEEKR